MVDGKIRQDISKMELHNTYVRLYLKDLKSVKLSELMVRELYKTHQVADVNVIDEATSISYDVTSQLYDDSISEGTEETIDVIQSVVNGLNDDIYDADFKKALLGSMTKIYQESLNESQDSE
jgi:hypothetical protein